MDLVRVVKSERSMFLMKEGKVLVRYHVALGKNPIGHKVQEGTSVRLRKRTV